MTIVLRIEASKAPTGDLAWYEAIPMTIEIHSQLDLDALRRGEFKEIQSQPSTKDYDAIEPPGELLAQFDTSNWVLFAAFEENKLLGGALVAARTPEFRMLRGRDDLAVIVDIRVHPNAQGRGVGRELVKAIRAWSHEQGHSEIQLETQDVNVTGCRFYQAVGFRLLEVNEGVYTGEWKHEVQLIWSMPC